MTADDLATLAKHYTPSGRARQVLEETPTLIIVGASGAGKGTIRDALLKTGHYYSVATHVTRPPRYNNGVMETEGVEHHFITHEQAKEMLEAKAFIEADFHFGNLYATSIAEFEKARDAHKIALTDIEVNGVSNFLALSDKVMPIFLVPPSLDVWIERLKQRYTDGWQNHADDIKDRASRASYEFGYVLDRNDYYLVVNDRLDDTIRSVELITQTHSQSPEEIEHARRIMLAIKERVDAGTLEV